LVQLLGKKSQISYRGSDPGSHWVCFLRPPGVAFGKCLDSSLRMNILSRHSQSPML